MRSLAVFDAASTSWVAEASAFTGSAGLSQTDLQAYHALTLTGDWTEVCQG
jgi:hypothetical protein